MMGSEDRRKSRDRAQEEKGLAVESIPPAELAQGEDVPWSSTRLTIFAIAQTVLFAANCAGILETAFILPIISKEFKISDADVQWVAASYMLTWGCFQLIAGRLCDVFGRKRGYILGCSLCIVFNLLSTFMPNLASLNVCRGLNGLASAIVLPAASGMVGTLYPPGRKRTMAYAAITSGGAAGASGGELFAGIFIQWTKWTWRPCFFITAIICFVPLFITTILAPDDPPIASRWAVDWLGAGAIAGSIFLLLLTFTISQTADRGWSTPYLPALLVVSAILFGLFALRQRQLTRALQLPNTTLPPPLIPPGLLSWKNRNLLIIYVAAFATWASVDSFFVFFAYLYFDVLKLSPFEAGLKLSVTFFSGTAAAVVVSLTISRISPRLLMAICSAVSLASPIILAVRGTGWAFWKADLWALLVVAYGTDATIAAGSTIISQTASPEDQSTAASLFQTSMRIGYAIGLAIATLIRNAVEKSARDSGYSAEDAALTGLRAAFWTCAGYTLLATVLVLFGMKGWEYLEEGEGEAGLELEADAISAGPVLLRSEHPAMADAVIPQLDHRKDPVE